jgi:hypothetical protein
MAIIHAQRNNREFWHFVYLFSSAEQPISELKKHHRSLETRINLSADLYDISQQKLDYFKPVDLFLFYTKTLFPI